MHTVFISYSTKDQFQADTVRDVLEKNGISCWMAPQDIPTGSSYTKEIPVAIRNCQIFVLILSQNSQSSHWVLKELDSAVNCGKVILPFMVEDFTLNDEFNFLLTGAQRYAAYLKKSEAMEALVTRIQVLTGNFASPAMQSAPPAKPTIAKTAPVTPTTNHKVTVVKPKNKYIVSGIPQCPTCGSCAHVKLDYSKCVTPKEKSLFLFIPLSAILLGVSNFFCSAMFFVVIRELFSILAMSDIAMVIFAFVLGLYGFIGGGLVTKRLCVERIRRQRIRMCICPQPLRCNTCSTTFLFREK